MTSVLASGLILILGAPRAWADYRYWTDAGGDNLWSTAANWSPQIAPISGDILVFGDPNHDNGKTSGFTINDIANLNIQQLIVGPIGTSDNDGFTIESTVGPLHIYGGALTMDSANGDVGLTVQCPVVIENGGGIFLFTQNGGTTVNFNDSVEFPSGGLIDVDMGNNGTPSRPTPFTLISMAPCQMAPTWQSSPRPLTKTRPCSQERE